MFDGELSFVKVPSRVRQFEVIWEETREHWLEILLLEVCAKKTDPSLIKPSSMTPLEYR
jgi:hypothetical protein